MKSTKLVPLALVLGFMAAPSLCAQDAAAPIRRTSPSQFAPTPIPRRTETPQPTPAPEPPAPSPTPAPQEPSAPAPAATPESSAEEPRPAEPQAKPEPTRSTLPSRRVINEKPVRAVEPRPRRPWDDNFAAAGATRPTFDLSQRRKGSVSSTLRNLEKRWQTAIMNGDVKTIEKLLADNFVGTSSTGKTGSKSRVLAAVRRDKNTYTSATVRGMSVRNLSADRAVVTGTATETGTTPEGKRFKVSRRFTDTWRERNGTWECVSSRATTASRD